MNDVSIIINGVRYETHDIGVHFSCEGCDLKDWCTKDTNDVFAGSCASVIGSCAVFKKSEQKRNKKSDDWISVKHKLPKRGERVLVCRKLRDGSLFVDIATLEKETDRWWGDDGLDIEDVTHWKKIVLPKE